MLDMLAPVCFVCIWSTGFIVARAIAPYADPCLYLVGRFALAALVLGLAAVFAHVPWPRGRAAWRHLAAGGLFQGLYLAASYRAVAEGLSPAAMALLGALQPPATAVLAAFFLKERIEARVYGGMVVGAAGVALVVWPGQSGAETPTSSNAIGLALIGVAAITVGALAQKERSLAGADLRPAGALQHVGATVVAAGLAALWGETRFEPSPAMLLALAWGAGVLSVGGASLLVRTVRRENAAEAVSLLFLVPPLAALEAYALFGISLDPVQMIGFGLALGGVFLARSKPARHAPVKARR
jgi:drug/metabolite transporter (DMT)-like permease